jgi:hypothetical protein
MKISFLSHYSWRIKMYKNPFDPRAHTVAPDAISKIIPAVSVFVCEDWLVARWRATHPPNSLIRIRDAASTERGWSASVLHDMTHTFRVYSECVKGVKMNDLNRAALRNTDTVALWYTHAGCIKLILYRQPPRRRRRRICWLPARWITSISLLERS